MYGENPDTRTADSGRTSHISRRSLLRAAGLTGGAAAAGSLLSACGIGGPDPKPNGAAAGNGSFDWRKAAGTTISILENPHPYQKSYLPLLKDFTELTGIEVNVDLVPEADYFTKLNTELAGGSGKHDVFMLSPYFIWQYAPPGWIEDLKPWLENDAATSQEFDFEDIFDGLRKATAWDLKQGSPIGTGGQWAIPWGFENNVVCYNKSYFDAHKIKLPDRFDDFVQLAIDLTDRSQNRYGVAVRGSKSWATIHPGFMTQFTREGGKDYVKDGDQLRADMNSQKASDFTARWIEMVVRAGPVGWTSYDYPQCTGDLGDGVAMMCYDADSATYPKNAKGASKEAGHLGWYPGPAGPDGNYKTNLWTWSWAMNAQSVHKFAGWLFIQWATGQRSMSEAVKGGIYADPVRSSVFVKVFKPQLGNYPGYLETFETVIDSSTVQFTPQKQFFATTEDWAIALQDIYGGSKTQRRLDNLARSSTSKVNLL